MKWADVPSLFCFSFYLFGDEQILISKMEALEKAKTEVLRLELEVSSSRPSLFRSVGETRREEFKLIFFVSFSVRVREAGLGIEKRTRWS